MVKTRLILFSLLFLGGCAAQQIVTEADKLRDWHAHQAKLAGLEQWVLKARIAIQVEKEGWTATLHWRQQQGGYTLRLIAPLGRGTYELTGNDRGVTLRTADNRLLHADNPEMLLQQNLGWQVPVSGLVYWIRGLPEPDLDTEKLLLDKNGRASDISQAGWQVKYTNYMISKGYDLPEKLTMYHDNLRIRLIIQDWEFPFL